MAKTKKQKREILTNLKEKVSRAKSIVFAHFSGISAKESEELRIGLKKEKGEYYVAKKTLLKIALDEQKFGEVNMGEAGGQMAVIFGYEDEVAPAKIVDKFIKGRENKLAFVGGVLENKFISAAEVKVLAALPGRQELYAKIVGSINAPVSGFVNALAGNLRNLVYVLKAIEEKKV